MSKKKNRRGSQFNRRGSMSNMYDQFKNFNIDLLVDRMITNIYTEVAGINFNKDIYLLVTPMRQSVLKFFYKQRDQISNFLLQTSKTLLNNNNLSTFLLSFTSSDNNNMIELFILKMVNNFINDIERNKVLLNTKVSKPTYFCLKYYNIKLLYFLFEQVSNKSNKKQKYAWIIDKINWGNIKKQIKFLIKIFLQNRRIFYFSLIQKFIDRIHHDIRYNIKK